MKNNVNKKLEKVFIFSGVILIAAALALLIYDIQDDRRAAIVAEETVLLLDENEDNENNDNESEVIPPNTIDPEKEMPTTLINGSEYIGKIDIPALNISLPVMKEWNYPNLKIAPCRYYGSVYSDNMVIAAHNYESFFGLLKNLDTGSAIIFTDADGNEFDYEIEEITLLSPWEVEEMTSGEYPLTLFTCNYSGKQRVTVRCAKTDNLKKGE
jgi:sortase A